MTRPQTSTRSRAAALVAVGAVALATASTTLPGASAAPHAPRASAAAGTGAVVLVQAVPRAVLTVSVDGREVDTDVRVGDVLGPLQLTPGSHDVSFADGDGTVTTQVDVPRGSSTDVVLHEPAEVGADPVVSVYPTPRRPIGPGKARVLLAHTATVPPADVRVDGKTVFTNIANGEYAQADVPAGSHAVALLPAGVRGEPLLGPLDVSLRAGTATMVYAVGTPRNGSMDVISHVLTLAADGSVAPARIETGRGGWAADLPVLTFAADRP